MRVIAISLAQYLQSSQQGDLYVQLMPRQDLVLIIDDRTQIQGWKMTCIIARVSYDVILPLDSPSVHVTAIYGQRAWLTEF